MHSSCRRFTHLPYSFICCFFIILAALLTFPVSIGQARPRALTTVTANNSAELITRINEANANGDDYLINLIATTYELAVIDNNTDGNNGLPSILNNGSLTINGNGATIRRNSADQFRIFHIAAGATLTLKDVTLENGLIQGDTGSGGGGGGAGFGGAIFNRGSLILENSTILNNGTIGGAGTSGSGGAGGGFNPPASSGGTGTAGTNGGTNTNGQPGGDVNGSNGGFGSGGGGGGTGGLGGGGGGDAAGNYGTAGSGGRGGHASGGSGGFGAGGGPGGTGGQGGGGGGGGGQGTGAAIGETGNTDGAGLGGDGGNGSSGFGNGSGGNGGTGGSANGGSGGFGGGGGRAGTNGTGGGGGGGAPNGNGGNPGSGGANGSGSIVGGGGAAGGGGSANVGSGGFGAGNGNSTQGGGGGAFGGAIFNYSGTVTLTNTTFYNNTAQGGSGANGGSGFGGALFNYQGSVTATNNTLSDNITQGNISGSGGQQQGGAIYNYQGTLTLVNNILANSQGDNDCQNNSGTVTAPAGSGNLIESHTDCGTPAFTSDPNLNPPQDNGGLTPTMASNFPSDVVDGGSDVGCPLTDQRGVSRPQRAACDIGAMEDELLGLSIEKKVIPSSAGPGETITYTLIFNNTDTDPATGIIITDIVPISLTNLSVISQADTAITDISASENYVWQVANLSSGQGGVITLTGQLSDTLAIGEVFTNTVSMTTPAADITIINTEAAAEVEVICATTFTVRNGNDSGDGSLREAIDLICDGGTITFDNDYNIYLDSTLSIAKALTIDGGDKAITISGDSNNDNSRDVRVFHITSSGAATLSHLNVVSGTASEGGGIYNQGVSVINHSLLADNGATNGGGIRNDNQLTLNHSLVSDNVASNDGGGIFNSQDKSLTINNSTLSGNSAQDGGAIYNQNTGSAAPGGKVFVNNSTLFENSASGSNSGAIYNGDSTTSGGATVTLKNSTLSANSGGGIITFYNEVIYLYNSIIANSVSGNDCDSSASTVNIDNNSLIEDGRCNPPLSGDPLLSTLADYGGETPTLALLPGSPAIDAGNDATCEASDQRGQARAGTCDIGAFESQGFGLTIDGGNNQSTLFNTPFGQPLAVMVTANNAIEPVGAGGLITFAAPGSGASLNPGSLTATTGSSGIASTTVTANHILGSYTVTATASGISSPVTFSLTNTGIITLGLDKSVELAKNPATPGEPITYTLIISNTGNEDASAVTVQDILPPGVNGADFSWTGLVTAGQSLTFTLQATIAADAGYGTIVTNTASFSHTSGSGSDSISFTTVSDTTPPVFPANPLITPGNSYTSTTSPSNFIWQAASDSQSGVVSYTLLISGSNNFSQTFITTAPTYSLLTELQPGSYIWTVQAYDEAGNGSGYVTPNSFIVVAPSLALAKTVELSNIPVHIGDVITYTLVLANNGTGEAANVSLQDLLPVGVSGTNLSETVTVPAGIALTYTLKATVTSEAGYGNIILNTATYSHTSGSGSDTAGFTTIADTVPPSFGTSPLITPTHGILLTEMRPIFDWDNATDSQSGVVSYTLLITSSNNSLSVQEASTTVTTTASSFTPSADLVTGIYTWTVRAHDTAGNISDYVSPAASFEIVESSSGTSIYLPIMIRK